MSTEQFLMKRAMELAKKGWGRTNPNPLVGAVIVKDDRIIAEGFHEALGCAHAEIAAINNATGEIAGGTMYVNLEPCSHYGRTPPCAKSIIEAGIKKVVVAMVDPNLKVSGRGIKMLKGAGIEVEVGILEEQARNLNEIFICYVTRKKPFVIMKTAMTLDGKIASVTGDSKWITGVESRRYVHVIRDRVASVMVGINTVIRDNPMLTTRLDDREGTNPIRIVADSKGIIHEDSNIIKTAHEVDTILVSTSAIDKLKEKMLTEKGVRIIKADGIDGRVDLVKIMEELYKLEIDSMLLEGGGSLNASAIDAGIVDKIMVFTAPKIIGGKDAPTSVEGDGIKDMCKAISLKNVSVKRFEEDILMEGYINR